MGEKEGKWTLPEDAKQILIKRFKELKNPVTLTVFTKKGENDQYNKITQSFTQEISKLSSKINAQFYDIGSEESKKYQVTQSPTLMIQPEMYNIRYIGAPLGEEGRSFIETILFASFNESRLEESSKQLLQQLKEKRDIKVFVTLSCPYCPGQVLHAFKAAIERPDLISAACIDAAEQMELSKKYGVGAVPHTVINEETISRGFEPEDRFIHELIHLEPMEELEPTYQEQGESVDVDLIVIGGGPAGLTAGLYAARSGLRTIILEKETVGGQVSITPTVENWPGFSSIPGKQLMDMISAQVRRYVPIVEGEEIIEIKIGKQIEAISRKRRYNGKSLILATGATHRKIGVPGEETYYGRGVSYCSTCDGYLYKGKKVMVIGGGNTALTDALYLHNLGAEVTIIHRRDAFRAEQHLQNSIKNENIPIKWNTQVEEIIGKDTVSKIRVIHTDSKKKETIETDAVFVAIGETPNNSLAQTIGLQIDEAGFLKIDRFGRTNIPRIYAAGDLTGGVRQIVTAVGEGATAATSSFEDISHPYWQSGKKE